MGSAADITPVREFGPFSKADITTGFWRSSYVRHQRRRQITDPMATAMAQKQTARRAFMAAKAPAGEVVGWSELWQKEDWWAIWLGLGLVIAAIVAYLAGGTIKQLAVKPALVALSKICAWLPYRFGPRYAS
jgi:hypothetical protein